MLAARETNDGGEGHGRGTGTSAAGVDRGRGRLTVTLLIGLRATVGTGGFYAMEVALLGVHALVLAGILGLLRSDVTGDRRWGRWGLMTAAAGRVAFFGSPDRSVGG